MNTQLLTKAYRALDQLSENMRGVVLGGFFILTLIIWYFGFWQDLKGSISNANKKIQTLETTNVNLKIQSDEVEKHLGSEVGIISPGKAIGSGIDSSLLTPAQMLTALHSLLVSNNKLTLIHLKSLPPRATLLPQYNLKVYEHGIVIKFLGDYFSTMMYLQAIENLKIKVYWNKIEYKVTEYPLAEVTLLAHTITTEGD